VSSTRKLRLAAVGDLHTRVDMPGAFRALVAAVNDQGCDALLLPGDLTDHGAPDEARRLADALREVKAPKVAVLGNHDYESGKGEEVKAILREGSIHVLDGDRFLLCGGQVGIAGVKGFAGGFDRSILQSFGEEAIKAFVNECLKEVLKLEAAFSQIDECDVRIALLHYAPVRGTCEGERPDVIPFLGSSRLAEPLEHYEATICFHGHAHHGRVEGRTAGGTPVYNVSLPLLKREAPDRRVFVVDLPLPEREATEAAAGAVRLPSGPVARGAGA
jgi:Icc-related predicted phosphoesterase